MEAELPTAREALRPHPVLPEYYGDEAGRRRNVARLFDESAGSYDRINQWMAFGSGHWYRRRVLQQSGLGRLCGGPTGGNLRGINGGAFFFLRLPASGLEVDVPLIGRFPQTPMPDAGLMPDIAVQDTAADIAAGRDSVMDAAMAVLG